MLTYPHMKRVALRDFQHQAKRFLAELPLELTVHNLPVARVLPMSTEVLTNPSMSTQESTQVLTEVSTREPTQKILEKNEEPVVIEMCSAFRCQEPATAVGKVYSEQTMEWEDAPMCKKHAAQSLKESING